MERLSDSCLGVALTAEPQSRVVEVVGCPLPHRRHASLSSRGFRKFSVWVAYGWPWEGVLGLIHFLSDNSPISFKILTISLEFLKLSMYYKC